MTPCAPIPPESPCFQVLEQFNAAIHSMQRYLQGAGCAEEFFLKDNFCSASFADNLVELGNPVAEGTFYADYGRHWRRQLADTSPGPEGDRVRAAGHAAALADRPRHRIAHVFTENRILWCQHLKPLLESLEGQPVHASESYHWRWDRVNTRPNGQSTHIRVYQFMLMLDTSRDAPFRATRWESIRGLVCEARHPLADTHLFAWQEDLIGRTLFDSYHWTPTGFVASFETKAALEEAQELLFKGLEVTVTREPGTGPRNYLAAVKLGEKTSH